MNTNLVTVFGGSGFLGRHTVRALARAGWRIKVATRHPNRAFFLRPLGTVGQIDFVKCDVADADSGRPRDHGRQRRRQPDRHPVRERPDFRRCPGRRRRQCRPGRGRGRGQARWCMSRPSARTANSDAHYAVTKAEGEQAVREAFPDAMILRPSHHLRARRRLLQQIRRNGALPARPAADRRRPHPLPAGLRGRCRRRPSWWRCRAQRTAGPMNWAAPPSIPSRN